MNTTVELMCAKDVNPSPAGLSYKRWTVSENKLWYTYYNSFISIASVYKSYNTGKWSVQGHTTEYDTLEEAKAVAEALEAMRGSSR